MNLQQLQAFLWLRWRLAINQTKRAGIAQVIILVLFLPLAAISSIGMFVAFFLIAFFALPEAASAVVMYVWDGLIVAFLFFWAIGLLTALQRSEVLSLDKFLHLPVSLKGAFLINYLSSLLSLSLMMFLPAMLGLSLGLVFAKGPAMLLVFPLLAAFLLMVTAITYQFQGWLASLMVNKRRRRTIIVFVTAAFILLCQLPNLINILRPWDQGDQQVDTYNEEVQELAKSLQAKKITATQYQMRYAEIQKERAAHKSGLSRDFQQQIEETAWFVNIALPPGWMAFGAMAAAEGDVIPTLLGTLGLALIGAGSLWRSYKTTVRLYTGQFTSGKAKPVAVAPAAPQPKSASAPTAVGLLEREIPWLSEQASAIALSGFRSLMRAPEAKMLLLSPLIMVLVFGGIFVANPMNPPAALRPLMAFGGMTMVMLGMVQILGNQFGFDRSGFRVFVLCAAPRRDILLGKNLACAPLALALGAAAIALVAVVYPMRVDYVVALLVQLVSVFLVFCMMSNCLSIVAPMPIASGSLKPANPKLVPILLQFLFLSLVPMLLAPLLLPLGVEVLLDALELVSGVPICLALTVLEAAALVFLYRVVLTWQGKWLQAREQKILETVTTKTE